MISHLTGTVLRATASSIVVTVGGVGFSVAVTPPTALAARAGSQVELHTKLIVREDDLSLYGFVSLDELTAFDLLISVTGVGPKSALGVLGQLTPDQLHDAIAAEDETAFKKVSGIGPKTARLIIVQLAGKLQPTSAGAARPGDVRPEVLGALTGLGWPERAAGDAIDRALDDDASAGASSAALLRAALAKLGPGGAK